MRLFICLIAFAAATASAQPSPPPEVRALVGVAGTAGALAGAAAGAQLGGWVCEARGCEGLVPADFVVGVLVGAAVGSVAATSFVHTHTGRRGSVAMATLGVLGGALSGAVLGGEWGALAGALVGGGLGYGLPAGGPVRARASAVQMGAAPGSLRVQVRF